MWALPLWQLTSNKSLSRSFVVMSYSVILPTSNEFNIWPKIHIINCTDMHRASWLTCLETRSNEKFFWHMLYYHFKWINIMPSVGGALSNLLCSIIWILFCYPNYNILPIRFLWQDIRLKNFSLLCEFSLRCAGPPLPRTSLWASHSFFLTFFLELFEKSIVFAHMLAVLYQTPVLDNNLGCRRIGYGLDSGKIISIFILIFWI